ncbi:MAG: Asp-tRNA(Asn)/Glu-tRNA(Gln) amidotransferase subunit GatC [Ignavibacteriales bacterium]|nr:Asp-tRNA(Asn)/Glu-tRNA(Gln) amidotransferase subunit GatC [Ignavibacteriales bacterium]
MAVTMKDVEYIAKLARLKFTEEEKQKLTHELNDILNYIDQLNKIDTSNVEPLSHVIDVKNVFREDVVKPGLTSAEALKNAPAKTEKFFKVPKVIGGKDA